MAGEGGYLEEVRRRAAALPVGRVVLAGFVREVERALWAMDVQVNASWVSETSSLSLLEGMSLGLPSIVSDYGGNPWLVEDGGNGLIFPARDAQALSGCMARLMENPGEREAMSRRAREIFRQRFTGEMFARHVEDVYRNVLKGD